MNQRLGIVELWRFLFCLAVLGVHLRAEEVWKLFHVGYLGVEFFFILSGYGIGAYVYRRVGVKSVKEKIINLGQYMWKRLKRLYPLYIIALLCQLAVSKIFVPWSFRETVSHIGASLAEFFMLQWSPLGNEVLIFPDWYVAAVFWGGAICVAVLLFLPRKAAAVVALAASLGIYGYYLQLIGKIDVIFSYHSLLRGLAGLSLGIVVFLLCTVSEKFVVKHPFLKKVFFGSSNILLAGVLIYTNFGRRSPWDFVVIAVFALSIFMMMLSAYISPPKVEKTFSFLGKISYPVYMLQMPVINACLFLLQRG